MSATIGVVMLLTPGQEKISYMEKALLSAGTQHVAPVTLSGYDVTVCAPKLQADRIIAIKTETQNVNRATLRRTIDIGVFLLYSIIIVQKSDIFDVVFSFK